MRKINVKTATHNYDIIIGRSVIDELPALINKKSGDRIAFIISQKVELKHGDYIRKGLKGVKNREFIFINDSEKNKNYHCAEKFFNIFAEKGLNRKSIIVSIGGGVIGDFTGFLSAIYMRGVQLIHVPTTLLAMVDSSIGGKAAVNIDRGKNMVGAFHQPQKVISDINFLHTLPEKEWKNGITEILKHGLVGESNTLEILEDNDLRSIKDDKTIIDLIYLSARFKSSIVNKDEKEEGIRAILNFGHTIGHSIESIMNYKSIAHGEAVAMGIKVALDISLKLKLMKKQDINRINEIIKRYKLLKKNIKLDPREIIFHMKYDKKNFNNKINFVLLKGIGKPVYNRRVDGRLIMDALSALMYEN